MRAALSIRVSDDEQARDGYSITAQEAYLRRRCAEWGYDVVDVYIDEGYSAKNLKRPDLQRLLKEVPIKKIDVVVFWRLDRWTRNSKDFHKLDELLQKYNCGIRSGTEPIDTTTAIGRFQLQLSVLLGQLERETTAERVKFVMEERHRKGLRNGAVAPFGYRLVEGKLIIDEPEAEVVRRIYELYTKPLSTRAIAKLFNNEGVKRKGNRWSDFSVFYILSNPVYCGKLRWNYRKLAGARTNDEIIVDGTHEPIVTPERFDEIQIIRNRRSIKREKVSSDFHFTGVLKCNRCGHGMIGLTQRDKKTGKSRRHYRCLGRANYGICNMPVLSERALTEAFLASLDGESETFKRAVVIKDVAPSDDQEQELLKRELDTVAKRRKKWQEAYANDAITLDELKSHMDEEREKEEIIKARLNTSPVVVSLRTRDELIHLLSSFREIWYEVTDEMAKKNFIQDCFKEIIVNIKVERGVARPGKLIPVEIIDWKLN